MKLSSALLYRLIREQLNGTEKPNFSGWKVNAHHVTLNMGSWKGEQKLGEWFDIQVGNLCFDDKVAAVRVSLSDGLRRSDKGVEHITIAVSPTGSAKDSNSLPWNDVTKQHRLSFGGTLRGQLQDGGKGTPSTGGGYTGVVLTKEGHLSLLAALADEGFDFVANTNQRWAEESPTGGLSQESRSIPLSRLRKMVKEELSRALGN